ncbi:UDP-glucose/GDP-mannose dehydrogenase family protein [Halorarum halophilum]|uniref:UDP-glucose 6-dehydrogenase n=1 Tax=Halorarum halophilum TaxID=2743090 RepID=A0A7D5K7I0_9EURY|nr:UDP-glucose 6-dehydrogenase AglM [Halobaculum halophilum]QLG27394.1 UDP-glucose/GDP-mannose dehydrogenase family protein [Halobaculum halophilum]
MKINVVGSGYVGTTLAASLAELGHEVTAIDIDEDVVDALNAGTSPVHEPGLDDLVAANAGTTLTATTSYDSVSDATVTFLAIQTPSREDGSIDTAPLEAAAEMMGEALADTNDRHLVVVKSTVVPPALPDIAKAIETGLGEPLATDTDGRVAFGMNPEFLREGTAVTDFMHPDKLVFGADTEWAINQLQEVFHPLLNQHEPAVITTDPATASMIKYANNAFLAAKISLINDLGNICKEFGLDAYEIADAIGLDDRIGEQFLRSGLGWGGSCFPKDTNALIAAAKAAGYTPAVLKAAVEVNNHQPERLLALLERHVEVEGSRIAILGLAFKPGTDDIRNSRAIPVIEGLHERNANVVAFDPVATDNMRKQFPGLEYADSAAAAIERADAALIVTDWNEFESLGEEFRQMDSPIVIDGRNGITPTSGMTYEGLTW